ncbi:cache domain-containing protein [Vibrio europaeus]|uniref:EAL domain-containing protein n=1 Tax=Vibrio europaeus TaxID=300876 RepID=A0AAE7B268_9VIBR|nr:cache domain-containing protein [Vibrio europaeus]MDC5804963.1 cache domain-containing protein [Vibrio europaeus]MDC5811732.1 cache domain-containing protein [Vibrio europaeus]MDC5826962.1 cache domain-containing protein [Vibrio europaeus]MDC5832328.1 cache domain-containing protein [Vibrio europaeus]MDC5835283.1 cache domain-containing protein [Vibrio europaeus]
MSKLTDKKLINLITYAPATIVAFFTLLWVLFTVRDTILSSQEDLASLQQDYEQRQLVELTNRVEYVLEQIEFARDQTEQQLESTIKERIYEAHAIATRIYENNKQLPEKQVTKLITDALRDIRFNNGRGYFFIYKTEGLNVMHPLLPRVEGTSLWDFRDVRGSYIVREMGEQVKAKGEDFYRWWFVKPNNKNHEFEKIGFGKYFAPYDWFIGTGDYVVDVENDIKATSLEWLKNLRFGEHGYVFVVDENGQVLSHLDQSLIGKSIFDIGSEEVKEGAKRIMETNKGIVKYIAPVGPSNISNYSKTSYVVKDENWGWTIGAGIYNELNNQFLASRAQQADQEQQETLNQMLVIGGFTIFVVAALSLVLSRLIANRFKRFEKRINRDFDDLQDTKDKLEYMACHDELTGLPNRAQLHNNIRQGIQLSEAACCQLAVMFVDLDDFKKVNDLYGHSAGDKLLSEIGKKFDEFLGPNDFVARFGGDEFIFCFSNLKNLSETEAKVDKIKNVFKQQFVIDGKVIFASCSIGVSMYPSDGDEPEDLISKADIVLYKSKARQKGDVLFFDSSINKQVQYDFLLERELREAIERDELTVSYQPQVTAQTGELHGVESLLRWHNPHLGNVSPLEFISLAEEIGLIGQIGEFVLNKACEEFASVFPSPEYNSTLSINISPMQLMDKAFISQLKRAIEENHLPSNRITLEITENVLISDLPKVTPIINQIKELGFTISLDDFGTGYSSLSYLSNLPLDELKIDRVFVDKMLSSEQSDSLVKAILAIAQSASMRVVAEGVETEAQKTVLIDYGCDVLQGYLIERPMPIAQLAEKYAEL